MIRMFRQAGRGIIEALLGIRRNALVGFVCVSTVALCLTVVGVFVLVALNLEFVASEVESQVEIKIYLEDGLPGDYTQNLERAILSLSGVREVTFVSKEQALIDLREQFGSEAGVLEAVAELNPLPDSFDVRIDPEFLASVADRIREFPGVDKVRDKRELVERLLTLTRAIRTAGLFLAALLAGASLFIIANTVRIAVFTRRSEISIMKLVGATDGFVRGPFMLEGTLLGGLGALTAAMAVWYGYGWIQINVARALPFLPVLPHDPVAWEVARGLVVAGLLLGAVGSSISIRRYLRT